MMTMLMQSYVQRKEKLGVSSVLIHVYKFGFHLANEAIGLSEEILQEFIHDTCTFYSPLVSVKELEKLMI